MNLLLKAMDAIESLGPDERLVRISVSPRDDGMVEVCVADSGPGQPLELEKTVFEPFVSTKSSGMGVA